MRGGFALGLPLALAMSTIAFASPAAALSVRQEASTSPLTSQSKSVTVACPAGTRVTGAGGRIDGAAGQVVLDDVRPSADLTSVTVNALEDETGTTAGWTVTAIAMCTTAPSRIERVSATSPLSSSATKSVTVACPAGKKVVGTGADVNTFNGQVLLDGLRPDAALQQVTVEALEDENGNAANWSVTAYAICADPPVGLARHAAGGNPTSQSPNGVATQCPSGTQLLGAGGEINSPNGQLLMFSLEPNPTDIFLQAAEDETGNDATWSLAVYAICARGLDPQPAGAVSAESSSAKSQTVTCPAGRRVSTAGGQILLSEVQQQGKVLLDDVRPSTDLTSVTVNAVEDETGTAGAWAVAAYAVCVNPPPGLERVSATSPLTSSAKSVTVACPAGKRVLGTGGDVNTFNGQVLLDALRPAASLAHVTMAAAEDETGNPASWSLTAYATCASYGGLERVTADSGLSSSNKGVTAECAGGKRAVGAGGEIHTFNAQVALAALVPFEPGFPPGTAGTSTLGVEDETGNPADWAVVADAVCAGP